MRTLLHNFALIASIRLLPACLLLVLASSAQGQDAGVTDDQLLQEAPAIDISEELATRQAAIENMQSELGVYSPALVEAYADMGAFYTELGDYQNAVALYNSALQIARISNGLYSEQQLPVLQRLIENTSRLEDWQKIDDLQQLVYHINSRRYGLDDEEFLLAATQFGEWKLRVVRENLLELGSNGLANETEKLSQFYDRVIADIELNTDTKQEDLLQMIYGKSLADIALARVMAITPYTAFAGTVSQFVYETRCTSVLNSQGQVVRQCYNVQVENPRYRESQWDAKQMAVNQYTREVNRSIDKLQAIATQSVALSTEQRQELESHIGQLQTESMQLLRASRRRSFF